MKILSYAHFHSIMSHGIIFCRNSKDNKDSCRDLFKNVEIVPLHSQYILSVILFVIDNKSIYTLNSDIHNINTRQKFNFHQHTENISLYLKGVHSFSIKVLNGLP
jgi:hypothetical protein